MSAGDRYATPVAFRRALTDRLKVAARESRWTLQQLQRQVAYDRLLERLYLIDDGWIVKGATALLARNIGVRGSLDVDLYREAAREVAEEELRRAAAAAIGDWFRFEIGGGRVSDRRQHRPAFRQCCHWSDDLGRVPRRPCGVGYSDDRAARGCATVGTRGDP